MFMSLNCIELVFVEVNTGFSYVLFSLSLSLPCNERFFDCGVVSETFVMFELPTRVTVLFRRSLTDEHTTCVFLE